MPEDIPVETESEPRNEAEEVLPPAPTPAPKTDANTQAIEEYLQKLKALCPSGSCGDN